MNDSKITAQGLMEAVRYLQNNPSTLKMLQDGGEPFMYEIDPMYQQQVPNFGLPGDMVTGTPSSMDYLSMEPTTTNSQGMFSPNIDTSGVESEPTRRDIRRFNRMNERNPQGLFTGDNFQNPEEKDLIWDEERGDWFVPSAREERRENRRDFLQSPEFQASMISAGMIGNAAAGLMGGARDVASIIAFNRRNQYVQDWYNQQRQRQNYAPISQFENTNYLGGMSFGKDGGEKGKSMGYYENGGGEDPPPIEMPIGFRNTLYTYKQSPEYKITEQDYWNALLEERRNVTDRLSSADRTKGAYDEDMSDLSKIDMMMSRVNPDAADQFFEQQRALESQRKARMNANMGQFSSGPLEMGGEKKSDNNEMYLQEGQYISFKYGGKMYQGTIKKNKDGKVYI